MNKEAVLEEMISGEIEDEIRRLKASIYGHCTICGNDVTEWDLSYGPYGGSWRGKECFHAVCLSGKLAVAQ